ncbi:M56 family metallopeptidase [Nocardioides salsibiostraticola]
MMAPLVLLAIAGIAGIGGSRSLAAASWPRRSPALGILAWLSVGLTTFLALTLAGLALAIPRLPASNGIAEFFHACSAALRDHYATPGGGLVALLGGAFAGTLLLRFSHSILRDMMAGHRGRTRQEDLLNVVGIPYSETDVMVLDHPAPAAYCLPGRSRQIVVTQGALGVLNAVELRQVLAHERAHIRSRHHLTALLTQALAAALFGRLGTREVVRHVAELVEMHADDAADQTHRMDLARAVVLLARGGLPVGAMGAGTAALARVRRLSEPPQPIASGQGWGVIVMAVLFVALPVATAMTPGVLAILAHYCPGFG